MAQLSKGVVDLFGQQAQQAQPAKKDEKVLSVSQLVASVKRSVEGTFGEATISGEISSFKPWRSGHWYFDLKDEKATLPVVMFRGLCNQVKFEVQDGLKVLATGRVSVYPPQSKIQLIVEKMEPLGQGALALAFEQLKKKLKSEGLFAEENKKRIPKFPKTIGLITSPQGAVLRDMLRILKSRFAGANVLLAPTRVQGEGAAKEIAAAIGQLESSGQCDVLIVGRGGGSLEDLWCFNEEVVARAIFACTTPIISAVGHETDFSISDFVADMRCATPTHAAQAAVPSLEEVNDYLHNRLERLNGYVKSSLSKHQLLVGKLEKRLIEPRVIFLQHAQRVEELHVRMRDLIGGKLRALGQNLRHLSEQLSKSAPHMQMANKRKQLNILSERLALEGPAPKVQRAKVMVGQLSDRIDQAMRQCLKLRREAVAISAAKLFALSPLKVISRGYSVVHAQAGEGGKLVASIDDVGVGSKVSIRVADGKIGAVVESVIPAKAGIQEHKAIYLDSVPSTE